MAGPNSNCRTPTSGGTNNISIDHTILAIESAIAGGSLAVFRQGEPASGTYGIQGVSRAEDLLPRIDSLLHSADINLNELDMIAVSVGPGSFTGLRIGLSTALGLSTGLSIPLVGVPLFNALAASINYPGRFAVAFPVGRADICFQRFGHSEAIQDPSVGSDLDLFEFVEVNQLTYLACHPDLDNRIRSQARSAKIHYLNPCLAEYVGNYAASHPAPGLLDPIYVQNPRYV